MTAPVTPSHTEIFLDGLWQQNTGLVALLGLCPLLAVSNSLVNGLGLGLATTLALMLTNLAVSLSRGFLGAEIRIPAYVLVIASVVTAIELSLQAWMYDLYQVLGLFVPLIVTNCAIMARAEVFASRHGPLPALVDGLATGLGFCLVLVLLGALREVIGSGTLFAQAALMFGSWAESLQVTVFPGYRGFLLALLPPGAFIGLALLIAARNWWSSRRATRKEHPLAEPAASERLAPT